MAISNKEPFLEPRRRALTVILWLAIAAALAICAGRGEAWHGVVRVDAGERFEMVVEAPGEAVDVPESSWDRGWDGVLEAGGLRVRWELISITNSDK